MIVPRRRYSGCDKIAVADCLDLLETAVRDQVIEGAEDVVQKKDDLLRREALGRRREAGDVGEEDGDIVTTLGDDFLRLLQSIGDGTREDAQKKRL